MKNNLIEKSKQYYLEVCSKDKTLNSYLPRHIKSVENWIKRLLLEYKKVDQQIVWISVYLHDIGQIKNLSEHHKYSEKMAVEFLKKNKADQNLINQVAHCVRAHRCKDVQPESLEAKIVAVADSASHLTEPAYINLLIHGSGKKYVSEKIERDYRDINLLPKFQNELKPLYQAWKKLIEVFPE